MQTVDTPPPRMTRPCRVEPKDGMFAVIDAENEVFMYHPERRIAQGTANEINNCGSVVDVAAGSILPWLGERPHVQ